MLIHLPCCHRYNLRPFWLPMVVVPCGYFYAHGTSVISWPYRFSIGGKTFRFFIWSRKMWNMRKQVLRSHSSGRNLLRLLYSCLWKHNKPGFAFLSVAIKVWCRVYFAFHKPSEIHCLVLRILQLLAIICLDCWKEAFKLAAKQSSAFDGFHSFNNRHHYISFCDCVFIHVKK